MKIKTTVTIWGASFVMATWIAGCSANTGVLCALAPYLPFNISACATPSAMPTPGK
jgi:hypothetical protein